MNIPCPRVILLLLLPLWLAGASPSNASDEVSGTFRFDKVTFHPIDGIAYRQEQKADGKEPGKAITLITLADFKIDREGLVDAIDPASALANQAVQHAAGKHGGNVVTITLLPAERCDVSGFLGAGRQDFSLIQFQSKTTLAAPGRVAGECVTLSQGHVFEKTYEFQLKYEVPVINIPKPETLPADGGEPGRAFATLVVAIEKADWDGARTRLQEQEVSNDPPKGAGLKSYFKTIGRNYPKTAVVTGGLMKGSSALLTITGTSQDGEKIHGDVRMQKTATGWRTQDLTLYTNE